MPRPRRISFPGAFFHIYNRGVAKLPIVKDDLDRRMFMHLLGQTIHQYQLSLYAYCLLDNHFHLFIRQSGPSTISQALWWFGTHYVSYFNKRTDRVGPLFQNRFRSRLVNADAYAIHLIRYIHMNPVEANIVSHPAHYNWSSYPSYTRLLPQWNWLDANWGLGLFHEQPAIAIDLFKKFHEAPISNNEKKILSEAKINLASANLFGAGPKKGPGPHSD